MIYLKKKLKTEKDMIIIKQSIVIVNMKAPNPLKGEFVNPVPGSFVYVND